MRRDPSMQELHHSDIITYALTHLAGQYAREKQDILRDLRNYRAAEAPTSAQPGSQEISSPSSASGQLPPPRPSRYL